MKNIYNLAPKLYASVNVILSGTLVFGLFQIPTLNSSQIALKTRVPMDSVKTVPISLTETFFGPSSSVKTTEDIVTKQMNFVSSRKAFPASLAVIKKHENTIRATARKLGVPEDVAIGVSLLENGGSETAVSKAGALGVFQLMPGTARNLGLTVTKKLDERKDPKKNIEAGITYLKQNYERFGDWGLATWAYHAGEGNVTKALQLYAKANQGVKLPGVQDATKLRAYVEKYDITIHKLLSSSAVKTLTKKLNDDSAGYPYKVLATATLFSQSSIVAEK